MKKNGFFLSVLFMTLLSACGSGAPESDGVLTQMGGETVVIRDPRAQESICQTQYCEPNYVIYASFGRKRAPAHSGAAPTPVQEPIVVATPPPGPTPPNLGSSLDIYDPAKALMNTLEAWEVTEGAPEIVVADIDSGIDLSHPDLVGNLWVNPKETSSGSGVDHDGNGFPNDVHGFDFYAWKGDPIDENGHGTHTAGTIAASRNDLGVIGVAPRVKIMPLRFLGPQGQGSTYGAIQAIQYAVKMGARVISASWGGDGFSSLLAQAVKDAQDAGVIFVAAAGNDGRDLSRTPSYPASLPDVFTVGSSSLSDRLSTFSNYGPSTVLVSAPGEKIYSTYPGGNYASMSGTSMATPQVSGAVALALSKNKSIPASQIRSVMCSTSDPLSNGGTQCGRINIGRFLKAI